MRGKLAPDGEVAGPGPLGGSANERGGELRASIAAWAAALGLAGRPFPNLELPESEEFVPSVVSLETDEALDDVTVQLQGGGRLLFQSKLTAKLGLRDKAFAGVLGQWKRAVLGGGLDHRSDRAVFAVRQATKPIQHLRAALARSKATNPGPLSGGELQALMRLESLLPALDQEHQRRLRRIASVLIVSDEIDTLGVAILSGGVVPPDEGPRAWEALKTIARQLARDRAGLSIREWAARLKTFGITLVSDRSGTPAARWEATRLALRRYRAALVRKATSLDLLGFGVALSPIRHRLDLLTFGCSRHNGQVARRDWGRLDDRGGRLPVGE